MTKKEFKDNLISELFKSKTMRLRVDTILYAGKVERRNRPLYLDDIIGEIFLVLCKKDEDWFWDTFNQEGKDLNDLIGYACNVGYNIAIRKSNNSEAPKACLLNEYRFASALHAGKNNNLDTTEAWKIANDAKANDITNKALEAFEPDKNDKNVVFNYLQQHLTPEEMEILDMLTNQKKKPGRKKLELQQRIEEVKDKVKNLLEDYSKNYYKERAWSIGEEMKAFKAKTSKVAFTEEEESRFSKYKEYREFEPIPVSKFDKKYKEIDEDTEDDEDGG